MKSIVLNRRDRASLLGTTKALSYGIGYAALLAAGAILFATASHAQSAMDRDVALIPNVVTNEQIMQQFEASCEMIGQVEEKKENELICNTYRPGRDSSAGLRMYYETKGDKLSIKTNTRSRFGYGGPIVWIRDQNNFPMDLSIAKSILEAAATDTTVN